MPSATPIPVEGVSFASLVTAVGDPTFLTAAGIHIFLVLLMTGHQVMSSYPGFEVEVHRSKAVAGIYLINILLAVVALLIYRVISPSSGIEGGLLAVGPYLLLKQGRVVFTRPLGVPGGDIFISRRERALDLAALHDFYTKLFIRHLDVKRERVLMEEILPRVRGVFPGDPGVSQLAGIARDVVTEAAMPADERERRQTELEAISNSQRDADRKKALMARMIIEVMSRDYLEAMLYRRSRA